MVRIPQWLDFKEKIKKINSMNFGTYCNLDIKISKHTLASNMEKLYSELAHLNK